MYAILDIETTGGQYNKEGITEIAIYIFDGQKITDQFISLVNPEIPIQPFVSKLTGINNNMLKAAPKFYEIAKRILEVIGQSILVAHNASFDYRILQLEFSRLGYVFNRPTLCTVELSQKLLPEVPSYSLGKLCRSLGIPTPDRHRASGDAQATLKLFQLLLLKDQSKQILKTLVKTESNKNYLPKWQHLLEQVPSTVGVFYLHDEKGNILYLTKSNNMYKKACQLFSGTSTICKRIQKEIFHITFEETGNELIANLKERQEIKNLKPVLNTSKRKIVFQWAIYMQRDKQTDFLQLVSSKIDGRKKELFAFKNQREAQEFLENLPFNFRELSLENHQKILQLNQDKQQILNNGIILVKGRRHNEKSGLLLENNELKGYFFFDLNYQISKANILKSLLLPLFNTKESMQIIHYYLSKSKDYKIIHF